MCRWQKKYFHFYRKQGFQKFDGWIYILMGKSAKKGYNIKLGIRILSCIHIHFYYKLIAHKSNFFRIDTNLIWYARLACKSISERYLIQSLSRKSRSTLWWHRKLYSMHFHSCKTTKHYFLYWLIIRPMKNKNISFGNSKINIFLPF